MKDFARHIPYDSKILSFLERLAFLLEDVSYPGYGCLRINQVAMRYPIEVEHRCLGRERREGLPFEHAAPPHHVLEGYDTGVSAVRRDGVQRTQLDGARWDAELVECCTRCAAVQLLIDVDARRTFSQDCESHSMHHPVDSFIKLHTKEAIK